MPEDPSILRLSFAIAASQQEAFTRAFEQDLQPLLEKHNLFAPSVPDRPPVKGIFSRLYKAASPLSALAARTALNTDKAWHQTLQTILGTNGPAPRTFALGVYQTPLGPGIPIGDGTGYRQGLCHIFSLDDGLPISLPATAMAQNRADRLWLATQIGLVRFDGNQFRLYREEDGLLTGFVRTLIAASGTRVPDGALWASSGPTLSLFDSDRVVTYDRADGIEGLILALLVERKSGDLLVGTKAGLYRFDGQTFSKTPLGDTGIFALCQDRRGQIWAGAQDALFRIDGQEVSRVDSATDQPLPLMRSIVEDEQGQIWLGTAKGLYSLADGRIRRFEQETDSVDGRIASLALDHRDRLWFTNDPQGMGCWDGRNLRRFTVHDGLESNQAYCVFEDRQQNLWVSTWFGLNRWDGNIFDHLTSKDGLADDGVLAMHRDDRGRIWFATWSGLSFWDGTRVQSLAELDGENLWFIVEDGQGRIWCGGPNTPKVYRYDGTRLESFAAPNAEGTAQALADRQGGVWFAHILGRFMEEKNSQASIAWLSRWDAEQGGTLAPQPDVPARIDCLTQDRQGGLWFGFKGGLSHCADGHWIHYSKEDGLAGTGVSMLAPSDRGGVWLVTYSDRWILQHCADGRFTTYPPPIAPHRSQGLLALYEDRRGHLWFSSAEELIRFDGEQFQVFGAAEGACKGGALSITEDGRGHLWFGTNGGINRYDGQAMQKLTREDGLIHNTVRQFLEDKDGVMWIATEGGITRYRPRLTRPTVRLADIVSDRHHGAVDRIELTTADKLVVFEFQGVSLTTPANRFAYIYRLTGLDRDWRTTYEQRVEYHAVEPGLYTFEVKAVDIDLNHSDLVQVEVEIEPDPLQAAWAAASAQGGERGFIGHSGATLQVKERLGRVAATDLPVLILGETGTGKGLAARYLHNLSPRRQRSFVLVNCGAIPEGLVESELFGHEKGAFTSAVARRLGKAELAQGGTLFLDEIGDLPLAAQSKLLHLLQERTFQRVGSGEDIKADVRVIAATNRDLAQMISDGAFRADLFYRLQGDQIELPPLRNRSEDIPLLAQYFAQAYAKHLNRPAPAFAPLALQALQAYAWPGNVRELEYLVQRVVLTVEEGPITAAHIEAVGLAAADTAADPNEAPSSPRHTIPTLVEAEKALIRQALEQTKGVLFGAQGAAQLLGINGHTLRSRMKKYGIDLS